MEKCLNIIVVKSCPPGIAALHPHFEKEKIFKENLDSLWSKSLPKIHVNVWSAFQNADRIVTTFLSPSQYVSRAAAADCLSNPHPELFKSVEPPPFFSGLVETQESMYCIGEWGKLILQPNCAHETEAYVASLFQESLKYKKPVLIVEDFFSKVVISHWVLLKLEVHGYTIDFQPEVSVASN